MKSLLAPAAFFLVLAIGTMAQAQTSAGDDLAILNGKWEGVWTSVSPNDAGYVFLADMNLTVQSDNTIRGDITWTLKASPRQNEQAKIGLTGVEHVRGVYDPAARLATFEGFQKDDPNTILGLDKYKVLLAPNNKVLGGITFSNGTWQGLISLSRKQD